MATILSLEPFPSAWLCHFSLGEVGLALYCLALWVSHVTGFGLKLIRSLKVCTLGPPFLQASGDERLIAKIPQLVSGDTSQGLK